MSGRRGSRGDRPQPRAAARDAAAARRAARAALYEFALPRRSPLAADSARLRGPYRSVEEAARERAGGGSGVQAPPRAAAARPLAKAHGRRMGAAKYGVWLAR